MNKLISLGSVVLALFVLACGDSQESVVYEAIPQKGGLVVVDSPCGILDVRWDPNGDPAGSRIWVASSCSETDYSQWPYGDGSDGGVDDSVDANVEPVQDSGSEAATEDGGSIEVTPGNDAGVPVEEELPPTVEVRQDSGSTVRVWMRSYTGNLHVTRLEGYLNGSVPPVVDSLGAGGYKWHQEDPDACTVTGRRYVCEVSIIMDAGYVRIQGADGDLISVDIVDYSETAR